MKKKNNYSFSDETTLMWNTTVILVEDSTLLELPTHALSIIKNLNSTNAYDLLFGIIYALSLETGFMLNNSETNKNFITNWGSSFSFYNIRKCSKILENYQQMDGQMFKIKLKLVNYSDEECSLICIKTGDSVIFNFIMNLNRGQSICLSVSRYVPLPYMKDISKRFRNLDELSRKIKDKLFFPIRNEIIFNLGLSHASLIGLPNEILFLILRKIQIKDLQKLSATCTTLRNIISLFLNK